MHGVFAVAFFLGGQINFVSQEHGRFRALYSGPNSLRETPDRATSHVFTLYTAVAFTRGQELIADLESAGGRGIGDALGIAGFTNLDVVRNPALGARPYIARLQYHAILPLSNSRSPQEKSFLSAFAQVPDRRLEFRAGKMSVVDLFDQNSVGSDSHLQFLNWAIDNNGAFDYAADTRGYTWGAMSEYDDREWSMRAGVMLMPSVANGIHYDHHIRSDRGQNLEFERRWTSTTVRLLLYDNRAAMGNYRQSLALSNPPDITATRRRGRAKTGLGLNAEHALNGSVRVYARAGWSDGRNESFAYTEVDRTLQVGGDVKIPHRAADKAGIAAVVSELSSPHRDYLAAGGLGFLLGDGRLNYDREKIVEAYYTARLFRRFYASADVQHITNPGYNRDRGPLWVPGARIHIEF